MKRRTVSESDNRIALVDAEARTLAETTFDQNVVVVAGAGTGKTTLLANRLIHLLMREPEPLAITEIVALTFTNKAASEMKSRLRERLLALISSETDQEVAHSGIVTQADLRARYGLSSEAVAARAQAALEDLEKAQIGTLHSFAAHLLRLYPIEGGVDPEFREDDGDRFEETFARSWDTWLDEELGEKGRNHFDWRRVLSIVGLEELRVLSRGLCSELVPLEELIEQTCSLHLAPVLREWFGRQQAHAAALLATYDRPKRRRAESSLAAVGALFQQLLQHGLQRVQGLDEELRSGLARELGEPPAGWTEEDFAACRSLVRTARRLLTVDQDGMADLLRLVTPFVRRVRASFLTGGWISFDGLLAKARTLLRDHPGIREHLKRDYRAILVDEFQDTDPSQYEIVLFLTEEVGDPGSHWRDLRLARGKLFIVGDPKQSIYAFRRADIEAFDQVVNKIRSSGGRVYNLTTNFRSHESVLEVINQCFDRLFRPQENIQPRNVSLQARPDRRRGLGAPGVMLQLITAEEEGDEFDVEAATRVEAEQLASWMKEELLEREVLIDQQGRSMPVKAGHVALLFRKLTQAQPYLDALRRRGIQYISDGERHFYRRQEVVELVNLLRVVENPYDSVALFGVLRSPLGGLTDREIYELRQGGGFDYRRSDCVRSWRHARAPLIQRLYDRLAMLHAEAPLRPLPEVIDLLFTHLPVVELAAASLHGEQAVANLIKIRRMASQLADRPHLSLPAFVELMIRQLSEQPEEAEGVLGEESLEAVRVLTIHKAKGLEFPVVILPGLHHGTTGGREDPMVSHDWSTEVFGISIGERFSLGAIMVGEKARVREVAEQRRLLYVGMTRAKDRLVLSGGLPGRRNRDSFLSSLEEAAGTEIGMKDQAAITIGSVSLTQTVLTAQDRSPRRLRESLDRLAPAPSCGDFLSRWADRDEVWSRLCSTPVRLTPSGLMAQQDSLPGGDPSRRSFNRGRIIGTLAHRVLELWDYQSDPAALAARIHDVCRATIPRAGGGEAEEMSAEVVADLTDMLMTFAASAPYADLRRAKILGREVPFSIPWKASVGSQEATTCLMEGVIDVLYQLDGELWVADYKTDRLEAEELTTRTDSYRLQAEVYGRAVSLCLKGQPVRVRLVFLRTGQSVEIGVGGSC